MIRQQTRRLTLMVLVLIGILTSIFGNPFVATLNKIEEHEFVAQLNQVEGLSVPKGEMALNGIGLNGSYKTALSSQAIPLSPTAAASAPQSDEALTQTATNTTVIGGPPAVKSRTMHPTQHSGVTRVHARMTDKPREASTTTTTVMTGESNHSATNSLSITKTLLPTEDDTTSTLEKYIPSSSIEDSPFQDDFLVLRNVCLQKTPAQQCRGGRCPPYALQFFGSSGDVLNNFRRNASAYSAWESDIRKRDSTKHIPPLEGVPWVSTPDNTTLAQFRAANTKAPYLEGTTIIAEPHHPDNNFHLHNDLILPILYRLFKSGSVYGLPEGSKRRLFLTHGSRKRYENRALAFDVLYQLFDEVQYPLESLLEPEGQYGGILCFERLIWGGRKTYPYYSHSGRYGLFDKWKGVVPEIRDWVNKVHGIEFSTDSSSPREVNSTTPKPRLTWIDRPCAGRRRCMQNASAARHHLSRRFHVTTLKFDRSKDRARQLNYMLSLIANTDILVGMHGAGLGHAAYLQPGSILVEIKDVVFRDKALFLNMANQQDIGYYLFDARSAYHKVHGVVLSELEMTGFTDDLWRAWEQEKEFSQLRKKHSYSPPNGECVFPQDLPGNHSTLSSFNLSRCYLEKQGGEWRQCVHYGLCFSGGSNQRRR